MLIKVNKNVYLFISSWYTIRKNFIQYYKMSLFGCILAKQNSNNKKVQMLINVKKMKNQNYKKDNGKYLNNIDFSNMGTVTNTTIQLINTCKDVYKDNKGKYVYTAVSFVNNLVSFEKEYINK